MPSIPMPKSAPRSVPPPPPIRIPEDMTVRSLECWSTQGCAGDKRSDAYAARAALANGSRYGLNSFGRLVFVFLPGQGKAEYDAQGRSSDMLRKTFSGSPMMVQMLVNLSLRV